MAFQGQQKQQPQGHVVTSRGHTYTILCPSGEIYKVKRPGGRMATEHFTIMTSAVPPNITFDSVEVQKYDEDDEPLWQEDTEGNKVLDENGDWIPVTFLKKIPIFDEDDIKRMTGAFAVWARTVLPNIIVEGLPYDEMPGEDQYGIFMALFVETNKSSESFRILDGAKPVNGGGEGPGEPEAI